MGEGSRSGPEEDRHSVRARIGHDDIGMSVAVQIGDGQPMGHGPGRKIGLGSEAAVPVPEQNRDRVRAGVDGDEVGLPVPVHIGDAHGNRQGPGRDIHGRGEGCWSLGQ